MQTGGGTCLGEGCDLDPASLFALVRWRLVILPCVRNLPGPQCPLFTASREGVRSPVSVIGAVSLADQGGVSAPLFPSSLNRPSGPIDLSLVAEETSAMATVGQIL